MATYELACLECYLLFEQTRSMKDGPEYICENCNSTSVMQIYHPPDLCIKVDDPVNMGHLADRNRDKMSATEFADKRNEQVMATAKARQAVRSGITPKKPWWRSTDKVNPRLATLNNEQKKDYVLHGSLPERNTSGTN